MAEFGRPPAKGVNTPMYTASGKLIKPGDFAAARVHGEVGDLIQLGEDLDQRIQRWRLRGIYRDLRYEHALTYVGDPYTADANSDSPFYVHGPDLVLEAEPGGAMLRPFHIEPSDCIWSTDNPRLDLSDSQRAQIPGIAWRLKGTPYSAADYFAITACLLKLFPANLALKHYVETSKHMICSQLVDDIRQHLGFQLFDDNRWNGLVDPMDVARCIYEGPISA